MKALLSEIREMILSARRAAVHSVDLIQVVANFEIGRRIVEHEQQGAQRAEYGEATLKALATALTDEFGRGFSLTNLKFMRQFYLTYQERIGQTPSGLLALLQKSQTLSDPLQKSETMPRKFPSAGKTPTAPAPFTLSWSHYVFLMGIRNEAERRFYEIEAGQGWSLRELKRQFNAGLYERLALSRDKDGMRKLAAQGQVVVRPEDLLKEPYVLEFLGLAEQPRYSESDLESAIIDKLEHFLLELGKGFLFEARQKRFTFDEEHFFVDLVFYNRLLRCYVLIDEVWPNYLPAPEIPPDSPIQEVFRILANDEKRNHRIAADVLTAYREGRKVLVLTERTDQLPLLQEALGDEVEHCFVLHGRLLRKHRTAIFAELEALDDFAPRVLLATGRLIGEGFDHPPLDTLVMAMPISWKGTLQQYAGRLHREHADKQDVRIYDYVENNQPQLARMWDKRQRGYHAMGYLIKPPDTLILGNDTNIK